MDAGRSVAVLPRKDDSLRGVLSSALSSRPGWQAVEHLVWESRRMALAYLFQKVRKRQLQPDLFGISLEDLALDCIAELFQRDEAGRFPQLRSYFESIGWQEMDEADLLISLRRIVFSKLNEGLFRRYGEVDASLSKLIRNLKNAVNAVPGLRCERRGDLYIVVDQAYLAERGGTEVLERASLGSETAAFRTQPLAPVEILESYFTSRLRGGSSLAEAVSFFIDFVREYPHYAQAYPLTGFAQMLRSAFVRLGEVDEEPQSPSFLRYDVERAIESATEEIRREKYDSYVGKGKVNPDTFGIYFTVVREILSARFLGEVPVASYFDTLQAHLPELEKRTYAQEHRNVLEYLVSLCGTRMQRYLQRHLSV